MRLVVFLIWERFRPWIPFIIGASLIWWILGEHARIPTGDAPHMLAISDRLAMMFQRGEFLDGFESWTSLVTPHPPAGYLVPTSFALMGAGSNSYKVTTGP